MLAFEATELALFVNFIEFIGPKYTVRVLIMNNSTFIPVTESISTDFPPLKVFFYE